MPPRGGGFTIAPMAEPLSPPPVKLICGIIAAGAELLDAAGEALVEAIGPADLVSQTWPFDLTDYYHAQMGRPLWRRFVSFARLADPGELAALKRRTNQIEADFARRCAGRPPRPVNLDVGYIEPAKLVLASMKNFSHRIYLADGVYAEITLQYRKGRWEKLPWTFPDYASGRYDEFLTAARERLRCGQ